MGLISRATKAGSGTGNYAPNTTAKSSEVNVDVNTLYTEFNGNIDNANIKTGAAIDSDKVDLSTISQNMYVNGEVRINGTLTAAALNLTGATLVLNSLQLTTSTVITGVFDQDDMVSNSAEAVPTQQSVKAYVDGKFNTTTGHDHDGSDAKKVLATNVDMTGITSTYFLYNNAGTIAGTPRPASSYTTGTLIEINASTSRVADYSSATDYVKKKEISGLPRGGSITTSIRCTGGTDETFTDNITVSAGDVVAIYFKADGSTYGYTKVYVNGVPVGTEHQNFHTGALSEFKILCGNPTQPQEISGY